MEIGFGLVFGSFIFSEFSASFCQILVIITTRLTLTLTISSVPNTNTKYQWSEARFQLYGRMHSNTLSASGIRTFCSPVFSLSAKVPTGNLHSQEGVGKMWECGTEYV